MKNVGIRGRERTLGAFMETQIAKLRRNGKIRTSETYSAALSSFRQFLLDRQQLDRLYSDGDLMLDSITTDVMEAFEAWHRHRGNTPNTSSFYLRIIRAVYNRAVESDIIENRRPFRHVYTGVAKTVKRAVPLDVIKQLKELDLSGKPALEYARDMFLMSFYLRGMSFVDMAFLRKSDLHGGIITYRRRKTGQQLMIAWTPAMQTLLDKYPCNPTGYLLPIIKTKDRNERCAYKRAGERINYGLKRIAMMLGLPITLTMYVARHSWASAAKAKGIPVGIISEGMGHDSEATTRIYLATLDTSAVDRANELILAEL